MRLLAIPADAPNPAAAPAFIDFMLRPKVIAGVTNHLSCPNAVPARRAMIDMAILDDPGIHPPEAVQAGFFTVAKDATRARSRMWTHFKTNR